MLKNLFDKLWTGGANPDDGELYAYVVQEINERGPDPGLYAKAMVQVEGDQTKGHALYVRMRVEQLKRTRREQIQQIETERRAQLEAAAAARKSCTLVITRKSQAIGSGLTYRVVVDGEKIGSVETGETKIFHIEPGTHELCVTSHLLFGTDASKSITVTLAAGQQARFQVRQPWTSQAPFLERE